MRQEITVKPLRAIWILVAIATLLAATLRLSAQDNSSKNGGVCFRVDDQHPTTLWTQYDALFKKYGSNFSFAANLDLSPLDAGALQALISRGNEMMDHTADHSTFYFTDPDSPRYKNAPGVDHYTFGINKVCLSIDRIDTTNSPGDFIAGVQNGYATSKEVPRWIMQYPVLGIYSAEHHLFFTVISYQEDASGVVLGLATAWGEPVSPDIALENIRFQFIHLFDVRMTDAAMALLAERTTNLCNQ